VQLIDFFQSCTKGYHVSCELGYWAHKFGVGKCTSGEGFVQLRIKAVNAQKGYPLTDHISPSPICSVNSAWIAKSESIIIVIMTTSSSYSTEKVPDAPTSTSVSNPNMSSTLSECKSAIAKLERDKALIDYQLALARIEENQAFIDDLSDFNWGPTENIPLKQK